MLAAVDSIVATCKSLFNCPPAPFIKGGKMNKEAMPPHPCNYVNLKRLEEQPPAGDYDRTPAGNLTEKGISQYLRDRCHALEHRLDRAEADKVELVGVCEEIYQYDYIDDFPPILLEKLEAAIAKHQSRTSVTPSKNDEG